MRILRTYLLKEHAGPFLISLGVFTGVLLLGNLVKLADLVVNKGVGLDYLLRFILYLVPFLCSYTIPMALLTAILLAFGRLGQDNELTAIRASGISLWRLTGPVVVVGLVMSLAMMSLNDRLIPWAHFASRRMLKEIGLRRPGTLFEAGTFIKEFKPYIIFVYRIDGNKLTKVRIYEPQPGRTTRTIIAERGEFVPVPEKQVVRLKLLDGSSDEFDAQNPQTLYKSFFKTYFLTLSLAEGPHGRPLEKKPKEMTLAELRAEIDRLRLPGIDPLSLRLQLEYHSKIAFSFACLCFIIIGLPLGLLTKRGEKLIGFALSVVVFVWYYLLLLGANALAVKQYLPPAWAMWLPNLATSFIGCLCLYRSVES